MYRATEQPLHVRLHQAEQQQSELQEVTEV